MLAGGWKRRGSRAAKTTREIPLGSEPWPALLRRGLRSLFITGVGCQSDAAAVPGGLETRLEQTRRYRINERRQHGMVHPTHELCVLSGQGMERTVGHQDRMIGAARLIAAFAEDAHSEVESCVGFRRRISSSDRERHTVDRGRLTDRLRNRCTGTH